MISLFYALSSLAAFAFLGNRFVSEMKPKKLKYTPTTEHETEPEPLPQKATTKDYSALQAIVDAHSGWTAEIKEVLVSGKKRKILNAQQVGAEVELRIDDDIDTIYVYIDGKNIGFTLFCNGNSNLVDLLRKGTHVEAYIGSVVQQLHEKTDRASIIAFYKVDGIAPTHVNIV